jgi:hypothetical protein
MNEFNFKSCVKFGIYLVNINEIEECLVQVSWLVMRSISKAVQTYFYKLGVSEMCDKIFFRELNSYDCCKGMCFHCYYFVYFMLLNVFNVNTKANIFVPAAQPSISDMSVMPPPASKMVGH